MYTIINSENLNILWASIIVEEFTRLGVEHFYLCPGSRSTPLAVAIARNDKITKHICIDERGAGFCALGCSKATQKPCVVIITSGTAVANLMPAVVEAKMSNTPLIILSADRPFELLDNGSNQAIDQHNFFAKYALWFSQLPCSNSEISLKQILSTIDYAFFTSINYRGPIHLNWHIREPLSPQKKSWPHAYTGDINKWLKSAQPLINYLKNSQTITAPFDHLVDRIAHSEKGLVVISGPEGGDEKALLQLLNLLNWPVICDISSNLRLKKHSNIIYQADHILSDQNNLTSLKPETILQLGDKIISKSTHNFLNNSSCKNYIKISQANHRQNLTQGKIFHLNISIKEFIDKIQAKLKKGQNDSNNSYLKMWQQINNHMTARNDDFIKKNSLSGAFISQTISNLIGQDSGLFISNSLPIRDMNVFSSANDNSIAIGCNRGASGIDGIISSAIGFCTGLNKPTTLLIGDLAFLHDLNSLMLTKQCRKKLTIVVINNNGGGIFSKLPIHNYQDVFSPYFNTPHGLNFANFCRGFNVKYSCAAKKEDFVHAYKNSQQNDQHEVIEAIVN